MRELTESEVKDLPLPVPHLIMNWVMKPNLHKSCELEEWGKGASMLDTVQKRGMSSCVVKKDKGDASIHLEWPTKPCECDYTISGHSPFIRLQRFFRASKKQKGC